MRDFPRRRILSEVKVFLGFVNDGTVLTEFMLSVIKLMTDPERPELMVKPWGSGPNLSRSRNELFEYFLSETQATHFLSVDTDVVFEPRHLGMLLLRDKPIVGGRYIGLDRLGKFPVANVRRKDGLLDHASWKVLGGKSGLKRVEAVGFGFTLIQREVLEGLGVRPLWPCAEIVDEKTGQSYSEDVTFCLRAKELGFETFLDLDVKLGHLKLNMLI